MSFPSCLSGDEVERMFVERFLVREMRGRALFELASARKRRSFFSGLTGNDARLIERHVLHLPKVAAARETEALRACLAAVGAEDVCYLMSYLEAFDRRFVGRDEGLAAMLACPMEAVLVAGPALALLRGEQGTGCPPLWLLDARLR